MTTAAAPAPAPAMENDVRIEGIVRRIESKTIGSGTKLVSVTVEHRRQGQHRVHTPWIWVFFTGHYTELAKDLAVGQRILVGGLLDTHTYEVNDQRYRRTFVQGRCVEVKA